MAGDRLRSSAGRWREELRPVSRDKHPLLPGRGCGRCPVGLALYPVRPGSGWSDTDAVLSRPGEVDKAIPEPSALRAHRVPSGEMRAITQGASVRTTGADLRPVL